MKPLEQIEASSGRRFQEVFHSFILLVACALSNKQKEDLYMEEIGRWKEKKHRDYFVAAMGELIMEMQEHPHEDLLGEVHQTLGSKYAKQASGEFYTPTALCIAVAKMIFTKPTKWRTTVSEPCAGSGRMILAMAHVLVHDYNMLPIRLWVEAWDVSIAAVYMTYINTTLWGIPCVVIHGNTISLKKYDTWVNIHAIHHPLRQCDRSQKRGEEQPKGEQVPSPATTQVLPEPTKAPTTLAGKVEQVSLFDVAPPETPKSEEPSIAKDDYVFLHKHCAVVKDSRERGTLVLLFKDDLTKALDTAATYFKEKFEAKEELEAEMWNGATVTISNYKWDTENRFLWLLTKRVT